MKSTIVSSLVLLILVACQSPTAPQAAEVVTDHRGDRIAELQASINRLQRSVDQIIETKEHETKQLEDYEACTRACVERYPWDPNNDETITEQRLDCLKPCDKIQPLEYRGC